MFNSMPSLSGAKSENDKDGKRDEIYLSDGKVLLVESKDPYGFWHFRYEGKHSPIPNKLDQAFTSKSEAMKALRAYLSLDTYDVTISPTRVVLPELKTKNDKKVNA